MYWYSYVAGWLHFASVAPSWHCHGWVWGPEKTGPPFAWLTTVTESLPPGRRRADDVLAELQPGHETHEPAVAGRRERVAHVPAVGGDAHRGRRRCRRARGPRPARRPPRSGRRGSRAPRWSSCRPARHGRRARAPAWSGARRPAAPACGSCSTERPRSPKLARSRARARRPRATARRGGSSRPRPAARLTRQYSIAAGSIAERGRVARVQALEERLGGEQLPAARGLLDARALVDLVAERGDLQAPARRDLPHVERRAPVDADVDPPVALDPVRRVAHPPRGGDRPRSRRPRSCRPGRRGRTPRRRRRRACRRSRPGRGSPRRARC